MRLLDRLLFYGIAPRQVRYLGPLDYQNATGLARAAIAQMETDFVVGPPITLHLSNPELMAGVWSAARECLAAGRNCRAKGELLAAAVSRLNECPYCHDIHSSMLHSFGLPDAAATRALSNWGAATLKPGAEILSNPPFPPDEAPQMIGTAICFHYLNRMVNVFLEPAPLMVSGDGWMKKFAIRMAGNTLRSRLANQVVVPGAFLTDAAREPLPPEFAWAAADPQIAAGFLRFIAAAEAAGLESIVPRVRDLVWKYLVTWRGESPGLNRAWLEDAVAQLDEQDRPAARLALTTALASYRVDEPLIRDFRKQQPSERDLVNLTAWASYMAVRRIASWLAK